MGDNFGDRTVVRLPLYADEVYIKGSLAATQPYVTNAIANIPDETDPRAMKLYHYGDPDIVITLVSDFTFNAGIITGYIGADEDIVLPYEINGIPVVAIGNSAFDGNNVVKTIKASKTLTAINYYAFANSSLTSLVAPSLTHIGEGAFSDCPLTTLVAPALTSIGDYAFEGSPLLPWSHLRLDHYRRLCFCK